MLKDARPLLLFVALLLPTTLAAQILPPSSAETPELKDAYRLYQESIVRLGSDRIGALKRMQHAVLLMERAYSADDIRRADYYEQMANTCLAAGNSSLQRRYLERAIELREKAVSAAGGGTASKLPPQEHLLGAALMQLAQLYSMQADFGRSEFLFRRGMAYIEKGFGKESLVYANFLAFQGLSLSRQHDYSRAQQLIEKSLAILEGLPEAKQGVILMSPLSHLAYIMQERGNYSAAETVIKRMIQITEASANLSDRRDTSELSYNYDQLAKIYSQEGRKEEAEAAYQRSEAMLLASLRRAEETAKIDPKTGENLLHSVLGFLSLHYRQRGLLDKVEALAARELEMYRQQYGSEHQVVGTHELRLGQVILARGDLKRARELLRHAYAVQLKIAGPDLAAAVLSSLAELEHESGQYAEALRLTGETRVAFTHLLGPRNPVVPTLQLRAVRLHRAMQQIPQALSGLTTLLESTEPTLRLLLSSGTEQDKRRVLESVSSHVHAAVDLHARMAPKDPQALALAFTAVLRRKGRALDAFSDSMSALHKRLTPANQGKLEQLSAARAMLAKLALQSPQDPPPEYAQQVAELEETIRHLEEELFTVSPEIKLESQIVTLEAVRSLLPADSVLVEMFAYQPDDVKRANPKLDPAARRYVAYLQKSRGAPEFADLGRVADIDAQVKALREALISPSRSDVKELGRALDEKVMRPLRQRFGDAKHIFLSPDGALNLVPFGALLAEDNRFLVQRYTFTYLGSGRDLIRLRAQLPSRQKAFILANPSFGEPAENKEQEEQGLPAARGRRSLDLQLERSWGQLPGTSQEAQTIAELLDDVSVLLGPEATENTLKRLSGPRILHVATHGFFLPVAKGAAENENPLLRSGLILAGANRRESGSDDGVLTALEASGLDLGGTQLVVLSACETGLGQVQSGDGVYGLRRALTIAGSETQIMSLWQVDDNATRDLMVGYYRRLREGKGRSESLRQAQLKLLGSEETQHPYYWASFIPAGDWQPMRSEAAHIKSN